MAVAFLAACTAAPFAHGQAATEPAKPNTGAPGRVVGQPANQATQPPRRVTRAARRPIISLEAIAKERRAGQVLPGDPAPVKRLTRPTTGAPVTAAEPQESFIDIIDVPAPRPLVILPAGGVEAPAYDPAPAPAPAPALALAPTPTSTAAAPSVASTPAALPVAHTPASAAPASAVTAQTTAHSTSSHTNSPQAIAVPSATRMSADREDRSGSPRAVAAASVGVTFTQINGQPSNIQYRLLDAGTGLRAGAWTTPTPGERVTGRIEIRTGLNVDSRITLDDQAVIALDRLSRVRLERQLTLDGPTEIAVELTLGSVTVDPLDRDELGLSRHGIRVRTPDKSYVTRVGLAVRFDAFRGTTQQVLAGGGE